MGKQKENQNERGKRKLNFETDLILSIEYIYMVSGDIYIDWIDRYR